MELTKDHIYKTSIKNSLKIDLHSTFICAGFPSPAEDHLDVSLDLNEYLVKHPSSTFYVYVKGNSMIDSGISDGDLMIIDRSLDPVSGNVVIAVIDGEFTVKRIQKKNNQIFLLPDNKHYSPICISDNMDFQIWGVVTHTIHHF